MTPGNERPLKIGAAVTVEVEVAYVLESATMGEVTLVIQQTESDRMPLANETVAVRKGTGKVKLQKTFAVPDTKALRVFTPLSPEGAKSTTVVDMRIYEVVRD